MIAISPIALHQLSERHQSIYDALLLVYGSNAKEYASNRDELLSYARDAMSGDMDEAQWFKAYKALGKWRRRLAKGGVVLPSEYEELICITPVTESEYRAQNLSKGSEYSVTVEQGQVVNCTCIAFSMGGAWCDHAVAVEEYMVEHNIAPLPTPMVVAGWSEVDEGEVIRLQEKERRKYMSEIMADDDDEDPDRGSGRAWDEATEGEDSDRPSHRFDGDWSDIFGCEPPITDSFAPTAINLEYIAELPGIELRLVQRAAVSVLLAFLSDSTEQFHLLTGYAGTGKTTILQTLIRTIRDRGDDRAIVATATTNKAAKVLRNMVSRWELDIDCITSHKLLALRPRQVEDRQVFEPDPNAENHFGDYRLVIVDECSMVTEDLWQYLQDAAAMNPRTKVILCGDEAQLPPVGELRSLTFDVPLKANLTEIVRYKGAVGVAAEMVRNNLSQTRPFEFVADYADDKSHGVWTLDKAAWEAQLIKAFTKPEAKDGDYVRAIAYRNVTVDRINARVRASILGTAAPQFVSGERLIVGTAFSLDNQMILQTSDEAIVTNAVTGTAGKWAVWWLSLDTGFNRVTVPVLQRCEEDKLKAELEDLRRRKYWANYWSLKGTFADVSYAFAITAHKSQGSTFGNVFLEMKDLNLLPKGRTARERNQCIYTAITRASDRVFICQ